MKCIYEIMKNELRKIERVKTREQKKKGRGKRMIEKGRKEMERKNKDRGVHKMRLPRRHLL